MMKRGIKRKDATSSYLFDTCFLADKMGKMPSEVERMHINDRRLMLAFYGAVTEEYNKSTR